MDPIVMVSIAGAVFVVFIILAASMMVREYAGSKSLGQRLDRLTSQSTPTLESAGIIKGDLFPGDTRSMIEKMLPQLPSLNRFFEQADFKMRPSSFWTLTAALGAVGVILPIIAGGQAYYGPVLGIILASGPFLYVNFLRSRRLAKLVAQLGEALELVAAALRAGHSLAAGMHVVAEEMPPPIADEFGRVWEEQNLGLSLEEAMRNLADRTPNFDLRFFVTAVLIQRQTGGDLAEILDKIGYLIRERFKILGMVKALTGEGRISGVVLIGLPFVLLLMMIRINYEYVSLLWTDPLGRTMSFYGILLMMLGAYAIRRICTIKV